ncbi:MAG: glucuronate isomerase [Phycisphaeraceae bacterium]|nr:glucuronate isomerase [Phycisphaeraceae bacterium]
MDRKTLEKAISRIISEQPVTDLHTHCYAPAFGDSSDGTGKGLLLWGIDELVTYHYLVAEVYRVVPPNELPYEKFWAMSKQQQADHVWYHLFVRNTPISEACRGVLTTLTKLGLDPNEKTLEPYRKWFAQQNASDYIDQVMQIANVDSITMTNTVFDDHERDIWLNNQAAGSDPRFKAVLRIDPLLRDWPKAVAVMGKLGYQVSESLNQQTIAETKRFLGDWIERMKAVYVAMSLPPPPEFIYPNPADPTADAFIEKCLLPVLAERDLPWAMMIGSRLRVNPALKDAGDMLGDADVMSVVNLCANFPRNRFMVTMLSRQNQHEFCVAARKFANLLPFGCWWFLNNPSLIDEITRMRVELLGTSFAPQHSDARILDQLIYKWDHSRKLITNVLVDKYADVIEAGFKLTGEHIMRDARLLLRDNYRNFCKAGYV